MSIVASIIIMVILSLIAISFARIMRQEQQQALERQLTTQAYYAAETAVNDVRQEINQKLFARQTSGVSVGFEGWVRDVDWLVSYSDENPSNDPDNIDTIAINTRRGFGSNVAMNGSDLMAVGLTPPTGSFNVLYSSGEVHIYRKISGSWQKVFRIFDNPGDDRPTNLDNGTVGLLGVSPISLSFGKGLAFSPDGTLAVGDPEHDAVHIFKENNYSWERDSAASGNLTPPEPLYDDPNGYAHRDALYGAELAFVDADTIVIGIGSEVGSVSQAIAPRKVLIRVRDPETGVWERETSSSEEVDHITALATNPCYPDTVTVPTTYNNDFYCRSTLQMNSKVPIRVSANGNFVVIVSASTTVPHIHIYHRDGDETLWQPWSILSTQGNSRPADADINRGSSNYNDLMLAVSYKTLIPQNSVRLHRYDSSTNQWNPEPQQVTQAITSDEIPHQYIGSDYGSALAFGGTYNLAVGGASLKANLNVQGHGIVTLYTYELPITETTVLGENQEECQVASGPLSERFLDDDKTVEYTCVLINTRPDLLVYDRISTERSLVVHLQPIDVSTGADVSLTDLYIWWQTTSDTSNTDATTPPIDFTGFDQSKIFPPRQGWDRSAPVLMAQLIPLPDGSYTRAYLRQNTKTFFLYPSTGDGLVVWGTPDPLTTPPETISGEIVEGYCNEKVRDYHNRPDTNNGIVATKRHCGVRITGLGTSTSPRHTYIMRLLSTYELSAVTVEGFSDMNRVVFKDIQVVVDATARAGHVLRRIQERLPLIYVYDYPEYALDIAEDICKDIESEPNEITRQRVNNVLTTDISSCAFFP